MTFKDLKIRTKLAIGFGLLTLMLIILGITQKNVLDAISYNSDNVTYSSELSDNIMEAKAVIIKEQQIVMELLSADSDYEKSAWISVHKEQVSAYDKHMDNIMKVAEDKSWGDIHYDDKQEIVHLSMELESKHNNTIIPLFTKLIDLVENTANDSVKQLELGKLDKSIDLAIEDVASILDDMEKIIDTVAADSEQLSKDRIDRAISELVILIIVGIILSVFFSVIIVLSITRPIKKAVEITNMISNGNLMATIDIHQKDEVGQLADYLNQMTTNLKRIVGSILNGASNISGASQQLSSGAQQISSGVSEQAAAAEEVSSSMEEMASNIMQNTENAIKTMNISLKSSNSVEQVSFASEDSMKAVRDIYSKINVVVEIAEKTDLLAINAAVEAARAGDQGRGFAVVAAEVRKLAERSQMAANEIVDLARNGLNKTEESNRLLKSIVPDIQETSRLVEEIASASKEQEVGVEQVNTAIQQLSMVTQQNASASEEMAGSSEELAAQSVDLEEVTQFFTIEKNYGTISRKINAYNTDPSKNKVGNNKVNGNGDIRKPEMSMMNYGGFDSDISGYEPM